MPARERPLFAVTRYRDARDVIPVQLRLSWHELGLLLAPERCPVRSDVSGEMERQIAVMDAATRALLTGTRAPSLQRLPVYRDLEKVAFKARGEETPEADVRDAVMKRANELREGIRRRAKTWLECWSPTAYRVRETRGVDGVEHVSCLVLDYDDGTTIEEALAAWEKWPLLAHTSWSHATDHPRFRLVLPLAEPIPAVAWPRAWEWARQRSGGHIDEACKDPSRLYILPAIPKRNAPFRALVRDDGGPLLAVDTGPDPAAPSRSRPPVADLPQGHVRAPEGEARRLAQMRLRTDRDTRERAAAWLGAKVTGRRAEHIRCPACGQMSVWFWIEPGRQSTAVCDHRKTCGWWGHLDDLLDQRGASHA